MRIFTAESYSQDELDLIQAEHRKSYLRLFKSTIFVQTLFPLFLSYVFYSLIPNLYLFGWLTSILTLTCLRGYLTFFWFKEESSAKKTKVFEFFSLVLSLIAGCLWGATVFAMDFNSYPEESVFLNIIVFGLTAGSVGIGSYWIEYFLTYNISVFSIYICSYLIGIPDPYYLLAISLALYFLFTTQIAIVFHKGNAKNIWLIKRNEKLADNLSEKKEQAEKFAASRTRFLASASHDLRQPLQAFNFFLSALHPQLNSDKSKEIFYKLESCTEGINELLNSMLDISKLDAKTLTVNKESYSLSSLLDNLHQQFKNQADEKKISLTFQSTSHYIYCDAVLLQRILSNLLSNAINYTASGEVKVLLTENLKSVTLQIIDTGPGLDEVEQVNIFEEFYQLENPERDKKKGLGLGLSIVKRLCLLLEIPIELKSKKGAGSCFSLTLPISEPPKLAKPANKVPLGNFDSKKILVIDDETSMRESLCELLGLWRCEVMSVESEQEACMIIKTANFTPELIIADYRLRNNKTGVEAVNNLKTLLTNEGHSEPSIIIISGDTEPSRLIEVAKSGYELLHKPVKPAQLRMLMQRKLT